MKIRRPHFLQGLPNGIFWTVFPYQGIHGMYIHSLYTDFQLFHEFSEASVSDPASPCLPGKEKLESKYIQLHLIHPASVFQTQRTYKS